jgi:polyferredoxin
MECIGCGLCIDACNETMGKVDRPPNLIRWDTLARQQDREQGKPTAPWRPVRARTMLYAALLVVVAAVMAGAFFLRSTTDLSVQRDRSPNFVRLSGGDVRNSYTVKISNKSQQARHFQLSIEGLAGATIIVANLADADARAPQVAVHADAVGTFRVLVTVPAGQAPQGSRPIEFRVVDPLGHESVTHESVFVGPPR